MDSMTSEAWTDDDRFFLVERMREKQREFFRLRPDDRPPALIRECKALEARVDLMMVNRKKPSPQRDLFGEVL
jgi:hypothetical protein